MAQLKSGTARTNIALGITKTSLGFASITTQQERIQQFTGRLGCELKLHSFYPGDGCSLADFEDDLEVIRPAWILAWNLNTFSPIIFDADDLLQFLAILERLEIELVLVENATSVSKSFVELQLLWTTFKIARKKENLEASREKARRRGVPLGRKPKGDTQKILALKAMGHSIRGIASLTNVSTTAVTRVLREEGKNTNQ